MMKNRTTREWAAHQQVEAQNNKTQLYKSKRPLFYEGLFLLEVA